MMFFADASSDPDPSTDPSTDPTSETDGPMSDQQTHLDTDPVNDPAQGDEVDEVPGSGS